jgi:chromosome partitioning protein
VVLAIINTKGGVGKTATAVHLAAGMVRERGKVLLIDADSQAGASLGLGVSRADLNPSLAHTLLYGVPAARVIRQTRVDGLDLITGSSELGNTDLALREVPQRELCLRALVAPLRRRYRAILIDCPPGLSLLQVNALAAAGRFLVPVAPQYLSLEGVAALADLADHVRRRHNRRLRLLGMVVTLMNRRSRGHAEIVDLLRGHYGRAVFRTEIPLSDAVAEASSFGQTLFQYKPASPAAVAYRRLTGEVLQRLRRAN